jgi:hypothetical protein
MKIIVDKLSNVVKYSGGVFLTDSGLIGPNFTDPNTNFATAYGVEVNVTPIDLIGGIYKYVSGVFEYVSEDVKQVQLAKYYEQRCREIDRLRISKTYTDVAVKFPGGEKEIQFRDEFDRANLANVAQAAQTMIMGGQGSGVLPYRTKDNVTQLPTALELLAAATEVMAEKQAIVSKAWEHKDAIRALQSVDSVLAYDINEGW